MFSGSLFTFRFNAHCHCVDAWISAGKSIGFDAMEKKKKRHEKRELQREQRERKSKEENKNYEITTWHVFISWRKRSVLC